MTEQTLLPPPDPPHESLVTAPNPRPRDLVPWLYGLGFLILAAAIFYLWQYPSVPGEPTTEASALHDVEQRLADIDSRLSRLEQKPSPDLGKITARVDALDGRLADQTQLASRIDTLSGRIEALSGRNQTGIDATKQQIGTLTTRVTALESNSDVEGVAKRLNRIARLQEASSALASGRPLGDWPDAPEALARYSHAAPPTEADLRLRFPVAEQAALAVNQSDEGNEPFIDRVWGRAQGLITIRRGDDVVVGNPASLVLNRARTALDAGDVVGAVAAVETLKGQPKQAMANWLADAKALVEARSALAQLVAQG